jgi:beta-phosphoglucomutase-like phosphatase (HAD superfamily)
MFKKVKSHNIWYLVVLLVEKKAVICDVDGTLIDLEGEGGHFKSFAEALGRFGVKLDPETYSREYSGLPGSVKASKAVETYALSITADELERITRITFQSFSKPNLSV